MQKKRTEPYMATYLHRKGRQFGLPIAGNFELTARCNFDCPMCYVHLKQEDINAAGKELTAEQWIEIARQAKERGMVFALLTGGEPFVRKDFFEIYKAMKAMGLFISINSNGSMLDGEIRQKLLEDPPFRMNISLYGGCNETYKNMCGQAAFDRVFENIRALKTAGIDICLNVSITPYNCGDIENIYSAAQELGVNVRAASYMYPPVRINTELYGCGNRLSPKEAARCSVRCDTLRFTSEEFALRAVNMKNLISTEEKECSVESDDGVKCRAGSTSFWMTWDGKMLPCGMMPYPAAHPLETGFDEAWRQIMKQTKQIRTPSACNVCSKKEICSVCAAICVTETGAFDKVPLYICEMTDEIEAATWNEYLERKGSGYENQERADKT